MSLFSSISHGYFNTMHIPMILGRDFDSRDGLGSEGAAIIDKAFALRYYGILNAIGRTIISCNSYTIIGVSDSVWESYDQDREPMIYHSFKQNPRDSNMS